MRGEHINKYDTELYSPSREYVGIEHIHHYKRIETHTENFPEGLSAVPVQRIPVCKIIKLEFTSGFLSTV